MRRARIVTLWLALSSSAALAACGGTSQRAEMPDVARTDPSADELGLPSAVEPAAEEPATVPTSVEAPTGEASASTGAAPP